MAKDRNMRAPDTEALGAQSEATYLGTLGVGDDEPTQLGQSTDVAGIVGRAIAKTQKRATPQTATTVQHKPTPEPAQPPPPTVQTDEPAQPGFVKVVATVADPPPGASGLPFVTDPDSAIAASYRVLRHRLREANNPTIIAVTSPDRFEGKTTCAANLAMALAEHGRERVLLVEANLRFPRLAAALGYVTPSCFARQMVAHLKSPLSSWDAVAAFFHNLHVLSVDPESTSHLRLNAPSLKLAMDQLRSSGYKHIVVDCPSALGSADVNVIEDNADGVLLVARAGKTTADSLKKAERHLAPANILGLVLT